MLSGTFVRAANPKWYFFDSVGEILTPADFASFLSNDFPYLPQNVFQDPEGTIPWGQPIQFLADGSLPDNLYFQPDVLYRIEIRSGDTQFDGLVVPPIENFDPSGATGGSNGSIETDTENQITNPQFTLTNMGSGTATYTTAGTYNFAPGWFIKLVGTATGVSTTLTQLAFPSNTVFEEDSANPPFVLQIASSNWTSVTIYQQFQNGALFSNQSVSVSLLGKSVTNLQQIAVNYVDSNAGSVSIIPSTTLPFSYQTISNATAITGLNNPDVAPNAYVQLQFDMPANGTVQITNIQFYGADEPITLPYQQVTPEREADQTFHYYRQSLIYMQKNSLLTGWNFGLNPWQYYPTANTISGVQCQYIADQTILYCKGGANSMWTGQALTPQNQFFKVFPAQTSTASTIFAIVQYIDPKTIMPYWGNVVSSLASMALDTVSNTVTKMKMRVIYRNSTPPALSPTEPITSWTGKDPVFAAGWTAITPENDPEVTLASVADASGFGGFSFNNMTLPTNQTVNDTLGIVFYSTTELLRTPSPDAVVFKSISLVPNRFAIESPVETFDQSLAKCRYYYEKTYPYFILPQTTAAITLAGCIQAEQFMGTNNGTLFSLYYRSFGAMFKNTKRVVPNLAFYSPSTGSINSIDVTINYKNTNPSGFQVTGASGFPVNTLTVDGFNTQCSVTDSVAMTATESTYPEGLLQVHYTADARLGVV